MKYLSIPIVCLWLAGCTADPGARRDEYIAKGNRLFETAKYRDASLSLRKALQYDPNSGQALYLLGMSELKQDNPAGAFQPLSRAAQLLPKDDRPKIEFADLCLERYLSQNQQNRRLREQLEQVTQQLAEHNPESYDTLRFQGYVAIFNGNSAAALAFFQKANQKRPGQGAILLAISDCLFRLGQFAESETVALRLVDTQPHYGPVYDALYRQYRLRQRVPDAEKILQRKVTSNPDQPEYLLQLAAHYAGEHNEALMQRTIESLLARTDSAAHLMAGDFYAKISRPQQAIEQYRLGATAATGDKLAYQKRLAEALMATGQNDKAGEVIAAMLKDHPQDPDVQTKHALLLLASGKRDIVASAVADLEKLAQDHPDDANLRFYLGRGKLLLDRPLEARVDFLEALRRRNESIPVRLGLAEAALRSGDSKETIQYADQVLASEPKHPQATFFRAAGLMGLGEYQTARKELTQFLAAQPDTPEAQLQLGLAYLAEKDFSEAERIFRQSSQNLPGDMRSLEGLVDTFVFQNRFDQAYGLLQQNLDKAPNSVQLRLLLAQTAGRAGNLNLAEEQYQRVLKDDPKSGSSYLSLAEIALLRGDLAAAIVKLEQALTLTPDDPKVIGVLASAYERSGKIDQAKDAYRKCLNIQPGNPAIQNNLAYLVAETGGDLSDAQRLAEQAVRRDPQNDSYVDTLGWVYIKRNMTESALKIFRGLTANHPDDSAYRYHLAMALLQSGDSQRAKSELERALQQNPAHPFAGKIRQAISKLT